MKLINKSLGILALACMAFTACSENSFLAGEWDSEGSSVNDSTYQKVSFVGNSKTEEIDPTSPTSYTIQLTRSLTVGECKVPVEVTVNTDSVFTVSDAYFADGDSIGSLTVEFTDAEIGKEYTLEIAITDKKYVSSYTSGTFYTYKVTRAKWNSLGMGKMAENFWFEDEFDVEILQKDDDPNLFRIMHPFDKYADNLLDGNQSDMITIRLLEPGKKFNGVNITEEDLVYFSSTNTGYFHSNYGADVMMYHPASFSSLNNEASFLYNRVLSYQEDGLIPGLPGQIQLAPYYYMDGVGGWNQTAADGVVVITFPGYTPKYEATIEKDFKWEEVFTGSFKSEILGTTTTAALCKGICKTDKDDCGARFEEKYGTLYRVMSPYAEEYDLTFAVDADGWITIPDEKFEVQPIGITALGEKVYAKINPLNSKFTEKSITLNITFINKDGSIEYGTTNETLSNITYTTVGTADYTYTFLYSDEDGNPLLDAGLELQQRDDDPTQYRLLHWGSDVTLNFTIDKNNHVIIPGQEIGYEHPSYGTMYIADAYTLNGNNKEYLSTQDEDGTYNIPVQYFVEAGRFQPYTEYLKLRIGEMPAAAAAKAPAQKSGKTAKKDIKIQDTKKVFNLVGKKTNKNILVKPVIKK